jgi:hypothetical protein
MAYKTWTHTLILFVIMLITVVSCNNNQNKQTLEKPEREKLKEQTCNVSKKVKLFLDFWGQMNEDEYYCVRSELMKSNKLVHNPIQNEFYYIINDDSLMIGSEFVKKKLLKIILNVPAFESMESYYLDNRGLTFPEKNISEKSINTIQGYLLSKYGAPIKNITKDGSFLGIVQGHNEILRWVNKKILIILTKSLAPVYKSYQVVQSDGLTITKYKIYRYEVDKMTLEYIDRDLEELVNREKEENEKIEKRKENRKLENL